MSIFFDYQNNTISGDGSANENLVLTGRGTGQVQLSSSLRTVLGTTTVAPLIFQSGTNLTTPLAGAIEWNGTNLFVTQTTGPTRKTIAFTDSNITGNSATADALSTARTFALAGDISGSVSSTLSAGFTITSTLPNVATAGTYNSVVVNAKGLVTSGQNLAYLTTESDTLASVTGRGATTSTALSITNATASTTTGTGALIVTGGVGIGGAVNTGGSVTAGGTFANNLVIAGSTTTNPVTITATGSDANVGISIVPKGTGTLTLTSPAAMAFGSTTRQMINLFSTTYGLGVQSGTFYVRTNGRFSIHAGGTHADTENDAGGGSTIFTVRSIGSVIQAFGNTVWHAGNDGATSGLDADLLDGLEGSSYARIAGNTFTSTQVLAAGTTTVAPLVLTSGTNLTTPLAGAVEWNGTNLFVTQTTGPTRKTIAFTDSNITGSAASLTTARTIALSGDATGNTTFDGSADRTIALTLANTTVTPGTYTVSTIVVDSKGRITSATSGVGGGAETDTLQTVTTRGATTTTTITTTNTTASTSTSTGALVVSGGVGIGGRLNIGSTLTLPAGTTTVPALVLTSGVQLTTASAGAIEWNGINLFVTQTTGPTRKTIAYTDSNITGNTSGTAAFANALSTAQSVTVTGDITGSGTGTLGFLGNISVNATLSNTSVTPGTYTLPILVVDAKGRVNSAFNGTSFAIDFSNSTNSTSFLTGAVVLSGGGLGVSRNAYIGEGLTVGGRELGFNVTNPNFVNLFGSSPGDPVVITATGNDTNVGISLVPKGGGGVLLQNATYYGLQRTMPTVVGDCVDIGTFTLNDDSARLEISINSSASSWVFSHYYNILLGVGNTSIVDTWFIIPEDLKSVGQDNDFQLEGSYNSSGNLTLRIRRTLGTAINPTFISMGYFGANTVFTPSTATSTPAAVSNIVSGNSLIGRSYALPKTKPSIYLPFVQNIRIPRYIDFQKFESSSSFTRDGILTETPITRLNTDHDPTNMEPRGIFIPRTSTNVIPNPNFEGATTGVIGSGGVLPTNCTLEVAAPTGITTTVTAATTNDGIPCFNLRFNGTSTAGSTTSVVLRFLSSTGAVASQSQYWSFGTYVGLAAGSMTNLTTELRISERNGTGTNLGFQSQSITPYLGPLKKQYSKLTKQMVLTPSFVTSEFVVNIPNGLAIDATFRIGLPVLMNYRAIDPAYAIRPPAGTPGTSTMSRVNLIINSTGINPNEGTVFVEATTPSGGVDTTTLRTLVSLSDNTTNNRIYYRLAGAGSMAFGYTVAGSNTFTNNIFTPTPNSIIKVAFSYDILSGIIRRVVMKASGQSSGNTTIAGAAPLGLSTLHIGRSVTTTEGWDGHIRNVMYWPVALTEFEMITLVEK